MPERLAAPRSLFKGVTSSCKRRVLVYGDSLTAGYYNGGSAFEPYGLQLAKVLAPELDVEVQCCGLIGLGVEEMAKKLRDPQIEDVRHRMGRGISHILAEQGPFDLAIIMGGTNDLAHGIPLPRIMRALQALHGACWEAGVPTAAMTVPPNRGIGRRTAYAKKWRDLNGQITNWAAGVGEIDAPARIVDVEKLVPFGSGQKALLWEKDGLHFSPAGYRQLGSGLASHVQSLLKPSDQPLAIQQNEATDFLKVPGAIRSPVLRQSPRSSQGGETTPVPRRSLRADDSWCAQPKDQSRRQNSWQGYAAVSQARARVQNRYLATQETSRFVNHCFGAI